MTKVMVADNSLHTRNRLSKLLTSSGHETVTVDDGEQAVRTYQQFKPDVVLMEIQMPKKDGFQALKEIRKADSTAKVIMITAVDEESTANRAMDLGATDFILKPVPPFRPLMALKQATLW
jgi:two-component system chemotaxis response regulator CheY